MIDRDHELSVTRQAELLGISRASVYYLPRPVSDADLELMRRLDALHLLLTVDKPDLRVCLETAA